MNEYYTRPQKLMVFCSSVIHIGQHIIHSPVFLAPMAGVSDLPFRQICQTYGAGLTTSEMITSDHRLWDTRKSSQRMMKSELNNLPESIQIVGSEPAQMAEAARQAEIFGAEIIDLNMGCPAKKVCKKAAGSSLLKNEKLVADILNAVVSSVNIPVTLKIRTGWDKSTKNAVNVAKIAEDAGIQLIAIHGRTRACRFNGDAEYDTIAQVKSAVSIPIIANGDINGSAKAKDIIEYTSADGVMIGRAAQGQPWLIQQIYQTLTGQGVTETTYKEKIICIKHHLTSLYAFYGDYTGLRIARKHMSSYLDNLGFESTHRKAFNRLETNNSQLSFIEQLEVNLVEGKAA